MNLAIQNISYKYSRLLKKTIIWSIINSILFFNFLSFNQEHSVSTFAKQSAAYISNTFQNILEQNYNERNFRQKSSENYNTNFLLISVLLQDLRNPFNYQTIYLSKSSGSIFTSTQNNHSLRSPPNII